MISFVVGFFLGSGAHVEKIEVYETVHDTIVINVHL